MSITDDFLSHNINNCFSFDNQKKQNESNRKKQGFLIEPPLDTVFYIYIDVNKLFDRVPSTPLRSLEKKISPLQDPRSYLRFLLQSSESLPLVDLAIVKVNKSYDGVIYTFFDPHAKDLSRSGQAFMLIKRHHGNDARIQVASPSYSGNKVMNLMLNFMNMVGIEHMHIDDSSTLLRCHKECTGALSALHPIDIIKRGKSWYETNTGAVPEIKKFSFPSLHDAEIEDAYVNYVTEGMIDDRYEKTLDYDRFRGQYRAISRNSAITKDAYLLAREFINNINLLDLLDDLKILQKTYPNICKFRELLEESAKMCSLVETKSTLGLLLTRATQLGLKGTKELHKMMHNLRDQIAGNKNSVLMSYAVDVLSNPKDNLISLCFAQLAIRRITEIVDQLNRWSIVDVRHPLSIKEFLSHYLLKVMKPSDRSYILELMKQNSRETRMAH